MNMDGFWGMVHQKAMSPEHVESAEKRMSIINDVAYSDAEELGDIRCFAEVDSSQLSLLYEELYYYETDDTGAEDDYGGNNSYQTIMDLNRISGLSKLLNRLPRYGKKRRFI